MVGGCWLGFDDKEPADVFDVARERVLAKVEDVILVVDSREPAELWDVEFRLPIAVSFALPAVPGRRAS